MVKSTADLFIKKTVAKLEREYEQKILIDSFVEQIISLKIMDKLLFMLCQKY